MRRFNFMVMQFVLMAHHDPHRMVESFDSVGVSQLCKHKCPAAENNQQSHGGEGNHPQQTYQKAVRRQNILGLMFKHSTTLSVNHSFAKTRSHGLFAPGEEVLIIPEKG